MRSTQKYTLEDPLLFKQQMLGWAQQYREVVWLDSNGYSQQYTSYDAVLAVDAFTSVITDYYKAFEDLAAYRRVTADWIFGYLSYDLKNDTENLTSGNFDGLGFADLFFFQPKKLLLLKGDELEMLYLPLCDDEIDGDFLAISQWKQEQALPISKPLDIKQRISKEDYIKKADKMLSHIYRGDIYEANFCMEFYAENAELHPLDTYMRLSAISEPPFAVFLKNYKYYLLSASPERYLRKEGNKVISQPIKGTARRSENPSEDAQIKLELLADEKERSENIMIVDLVRNDLSHTAEKQSVKVEELCEAYTFKQVHHLISTVTSVVHEDCVAEEVLRTTFPMGSMTGAPKISAMQIIENLEETKRGLYSGAVGYFTPNGDFDFNVVIRSILYNELNRYVSFSVGSAITVEATPEKEYEECLLKAGAMYRVLNNNL